ncbi:RNA 2',3'-cyclic phosphodiesterase [Silvimonas iriomotensis]|uniref:RNA 2',3'-cyclic phosphodiesterase n=1 Tax=Silvimonas iriomotensis TaxID=449662 RepID=A0ABQ2P526_9NEIS|nr:RNA 2',3'-cyclic phosphodiesterase [Silvimonas iriomotensis]GGP18063.1 RNA 2',3'-cyclic phosphodiesterase [Silvimonas iriomotensis]
MTATARLFIGLTPPPAVRQQLVAVRDRLHAVAGGKPVAQANLHLTLAFLGQTPVARVEELASLIDQCGFMPMTLQLASVGSFSRANVTWAGPAERHMMLDGLAARLHQSLQQHHFSVDAQGFSAHVTLLRKVACPPQTLTPAIIWRASQLSLYESRSTPDGVEYHILHRVISSAGHPQT